jgi:hypothetical protein
LVGATDLFPAHVGVDPSDYGEPMLSPLRAIRDAIEPDETYTVGELAALLGVSAGTVRSLKDGQQIPDHDQPWKRFVDHGGRAGQWSGAALLAAADSEVEVPDLDHDRYSTATLWRIGCRCKTCHADHIEQTRTQRRQAALRAFPPAKQRIVLQEITDGMDLPAAAALVGVTRSQVYGLAIADEDFGAALREATWSLCRDPGGPKCGNASGYYSLRCRGTGCRDYRRDLAVRERSA